MRKDWTAIEPFRVTYGFFASRPGKPFGMFKVDFDGVILKCIAHDGKGDMAEAELLGWEHVSVSIEDSPTTVPTWEQMAHVKRLFWDDEECVVQYHPAKSEYVNRHPGCLHLWRPVDGNFPTPPKILVG
jgi:hypothetical protein